MADANSDLEKSEKEGLVTEEGEQPAIESAVKSTQEEISAKIKSGEIEQPIEAVKKVDFPKLMTLELMEKWGDSIPVYSEADPKKPEWKSTPVIPINIPNFGVVLIKNEADRGSNPTGTIKDRAAWELATLYRDYARALYLKLRGGHLTKDELRAMNIPRLTFLTSGNEGRAVAECFKKYGIAPPKLLLSKDIDPEILKTLKKLDADVYLADLSKRKLTTEEILRLTDNEGGTDITSVQFIEPQSTFYDWQAHETFNIEPNRLYVPYGSGRLMENYLYWQTHTIRDAAKGIHDPRLKAPSLKVASMNIHGAEPEKPDSIADKLTAPFKPFLIFRDHDIRGAVNFSFTGKETGREKTREDLIRDAHRMLNANGIEAEQSGAAGLALFLQHLEEGKVQKGEKVEVVNTGKGLVSEDSLGTFK